VHLGHVIVSTSANWWTVSTQASSFSSSFSSYLLHSRHVVHALHHVTFFQWFGLRGADDRERDQAHEDGKRSKLHNSIRRLAKGIDLTRKKYLLLLIKVLLLKNVAMTSANHCGF
jgi:hypothetical protein